MGASAILTGLSSRIAQTLVDLGVDLGTIKTVGDLQGGLEEAEHLLHTSAPGVDEAPSRSSQ
jgi:rsbT co-antagonist protein RsbR